MILATPTLGVNPLASSAEVSGYLVGSTAFKAVGTSDPRPAGSIPVHLRQQPAGQMLFRPTKDADWSQNGHSGGASIVCCPGVQFRFMLDVVAPVGVFRFGDWLR